MSHTTPHPASRPSAAQPPSPTRGEGGSQRRILRSSRLLCFLAAAIIIALLPLFFTASYWRTNLVVCAINVMLALGLDFILGYAGQLNLGQSAFYGIGAYVSTLLVAKAGWPFWPALSCGTLAAGVA